MTDSSEAGTRDAFMLDLFRMEVETQVLNLSEGSLVLEREPQATENLEALMRAAHSIKGAARIVQLETVVELAHALEDCFVAIPQGTLVVTSDQLDALLQGVDQLAPVARVGAEDIPGWLAAHEAELRQATEALQALLHPGTAVSSPPSLRPERRRAPTALERQPESGRPKEQRQATEQTEPPSPTTLRDEPVDRNRVLRVTAENVDRLMGLAGENLVESRWLQPFVNSLLRLKKSHVDLASILDRLRESWEELEVTERTKRYVNDAQRKATECRQELSHHLAELETLASRSANLSDRLYHEAIATRMRPFSDGVQAFPRMVRDLAKNLGKQATLEIVGKSTEVDRDLLEKLEAPLNHLLRNALDHGIETPEKRRAAGKPAEGTVRLEALHKAGRLLITVSDDGRGVDMDHLRQAIVRKKLATAEIAEALTENELLEFLFLPGFSTAATVTEVSGRGVGLDVVHSMVGEVGGVVRAVSEVGKGTSFHLQLPLTLSVIRALLVDIAGEPYAFPLTRIDRVVMVAQTDVQILENRPYFVLDDRNIGLISADQVLDVHGAPPPLEQLPVIAVSDRLNRVGLIVNAFLGESDLVVQPLDPRLGKVPNISAAALMKDGSPVLIVDVADIVQSIDTVVSGRRSHPDTQPPDALDQRPRKRILIIEDSLTVREVERRLLESNGYEVDVAVDGMDGWNTVRRGQYDLVISDVDMPRLNGFELVSLIKKDARLKSVPVMILSYKDRDADRLQGLQAGARSYLTKGNFDDETLLTTVADLIGRAKA